jgi:hypothetical protein
MGLEPAAFRVVAYCLNHYTTACPILLYSLKRTVITLQFERKREGLVPFTAAQQTGTRSLDALA